MTMYAEKRLSIVYIYLFYKNELTIILYFIENIFLINLYGAGGLRGLRGPLFNGHIVRIIL